MPPDYAAEMRPYDTYVGEFRVHYAGFLIQGLAMMLLAEVAAAGRPRGSLS